MRQPGNMASSETFTGLASEADGLFLCQNISGTGESELGQHSDKFYPEEGVPTDGVLAVTCFGLMINELPSWTCSGHWVTRAHVRFCWVPRHCGIDGNERVDQLAKETLDQEIDPLASAHYTDMKPLVNSYIQKLVQTKWDVAVRGRDLAIWHHPRPSQDWPQRQTACFCVRISQGPANRNQYWDNTLWQILPRGRCHNWWCPGCDMFWTED